MSKSKKKNNSVTNNDYSTLINDINGVLENARKFSARAVNSILTSTYWLIGRRIVEYEFQGMDRSEYYGDKLLENLSIDLQKKFGRGFSRQNIQLMKQFYETYLFEKISQTPSGKSSGNANIRQTLSNKSLAADNIPQTPSAQSLLIELSNKFPLSWSHYVRLLSVKNEKARKFYETESLRCGWSVR